jgi:hypothetical protein
VNIKHKRFSKSDQFIAKEFYCRFHNRKQENPMSRINRSLLLIILYSSILFPQTSLLTGQASQSIPLAPGAVLQYSSDIAVNVQTRNEVYPAGWVGLGWKFGIPSISVAHNNTVAIADDRWFLNDGYGNTSEIIRTI